MKSSDTLKDKIKKEEGFSSKAYKDGMIDGKQMYSIGYGHQILPNENHLLTATITRSQADDLFDKDIVKFENAVKLAKRPLNQNQFDALVSFAYNAGTGAVAKVLETWNETGDSTKTTDRMKLYNKWRVNGVLQVNQGLVSRRLKEATLFLTDAFDNVVTEAKKKACNCDCPRCGYNINISLS
jgi:lysozyme